MTAPAHPRRIAAALLVAFCSLGAATADAKSVSVSGTQTVVDEEAGIFEMHGDLVGGWRITTFKELATSPLYQAKGTEKFRGCIDRDRDGACEGDPSGTLSFRFRYWALFGPDDALLAGACWHPIVSGTGAFRHARGVIQMLDAPTDNGVETTYVGDIRMGKSHSKSTAAASRRACGAVN
jgi:hypothetical protein